ncbi:thiazole synthase [Sulfobacillus sp. hq2]|uniref:Thiazole synthase n=1 Tax=Sulfobacillus thermotolerans TaxID=338644 RepID=A0ABN5H3M0_9FIRM|nr:thiazole synthase [Sulfobacillus sp. hq2]AUW95191.1 thiazole synthase [Sulfobacillus thermotolerans]POB10154.1 thiazole synthase [Sulfobacillus sp. hq2]
MSICPDGPVKIGPYAFHSRLFVGTGKYMSDAIMQEAITASGTELVTVALRRVDLSQPKKPSLLEALPSSVKILPNTAGCHTVQDALLVADIARAAGIGDLIKLEMIGDNEWLWPDPILTLEATKRLVQKGFAVMVYTSPDPVLAKHLEDEGAAAVMPLGSPIGSGQGIVNTEVIGRIKERVTRVPIVVDAGIGAAADAAMAMELGADAVLINTAIALAQDPVAMAQAMKWAVMAGRQGFLAGRMTKQWRASASSPAQGQVRAHVPS